MCKQIHISLRYGLPQWNSPHQIFAHLRGAAALCFGQGLQGLVNSVMKHAFPVKTGGFTIKPGRKCVFNQQLGETCDWNRERIEIDVKGANVLHIFTQEVWQQHLVLRTSACAEPSFQAILFASLRTPRIIDRIKLQKSLGRPPWNPIWMRPKASATGPAGFTWDLYISSLASFRWTYKKVAKHGKTLAHVFPVVPLVPTCSENSMSSQLINHLPSMLPYLFEN